MGLTRLKSRCRQGWFLLQALGESALPGLLQLLGAALNPWLVAPSTVKASNGQSRLGPSAPLSLHLKDPCDYIGPTG